jgi:2,4-diaminopentanoate dehydrogenase
MREDDMTYRVIVWGPGEVGGTALRAILKRPEFAVVGCKVYSDSKDGVDIGTLAGGEPIGVTATKCSDELIALHADCVVHTPMLPFDISDTDDEIIRLLESGKNVVSAVSYTAPEFFGADYIAKFEDACQRGGVSFHGSGLYPGFVERLAVGLTGCVTEVNHVSIVEAADGLRALSPMVLQFAGWGQDPDVVAAGNAVTEVQKRFYFQSVAYIARRLFDLQPDQYRIDTTFRGIPASETFVASPDLTIEPGQTLLLHNTYVGTADDGREFFRGDWYWYLGADNYPLDHGAAGGSHYGINIQTPDTNLAMNLDATVAADDRIAATTYLTAAPLVTAIVPVCDARPGVVYLDTPSFAPPRFAAPADPVAAG